MNIEALLLSYRDYYGSYHHHKERMAYTAATLYLGAATAAIFEGHDILGSGFRTPIIVIMLVAGVLVGFSFVVWQLGNRRRAGDIVSASTSLLAKQLAGELEKPDMSRWRYWDQDFPKFLVDQLDHVADLRGLFRGAGPSETITWIAMGLWTLLATLRICS